MLRIPPSSTLFFFNDTATTEIYTLSLHDALPISIFSNLLLAAKQMENSHESAHEKVLKYLRRLDMVDQAQLYPAQISGGQRSEEHTSELQSQSNIVCRLLLEKKKL